MEEFLQRTKSKLNQSKRLEKVHVVLGNKPSDLDSLISALTYAYFLDKVSPPDVLCLPVLNIPRREFSYYTETKFILEELNIPESFHIFQDEINLHQLNDEGKLSLTLVNSSILASDDKSLESAVVKVINPDERCDANLELQESSSSLVVKEILQEAPELITQQLAHLLRGSILFKYMSMGPERITEKQEEILSILEEKFPELPPREDIISVFQETHFNAQGLNIEEAVLKDLKELSDGEIKIAISTVYMTLEDCIFHRNITGDLKACVDKHGFDVLVILANYLSEEEQTKRQIAVYSENLELCNQICCELEECQNPCLELDPLECGCDQLFVYHQDNTLVTCDQILLIIKEVVNRRQPEMVPNSRTSSTEAVAGSAPLSQGSSGIMELYGSDVEPQPSSVNFIENPQDINGSIQAHVDVNVDLVSPDSGLATIRSSRSSKESSVFLSDDSPVAEGAASHHSLLPGFDSYSPIPEGAIPEEQPPQSRNNSDNFDLFSFDLTPMVTVRSESSSHSVDYSPADDFFLNSDSSEGQLPIVQKELDETNLSENDLANYSTDLLVTTNEDDNLVQFDDEFRQENPGDLCEKTSSMTDLVEDGSSSPEVFKNVETRIPPTPMNSLVESSPLDNGPPLFFPQDVIKKINEIDSASYSQSRVRYGSWWEGFELDTKNADAWSSSEQESVFQSPDSWKDRKASPLLRERFDRRASDSVFLQKQSRQMDYSRTGLWENQLNPVQDKHSLELQKKTTECSHWQSASLEETEQQMEEFTDLWKSNQLTPMISAPWHSAVDESGQLDTESYDSWTEFDQEDETKPSENVWSMPKLDTDQTSVSSLDVWAMSRTSLSDFSEITAENECENINNEISTESWNKGRAYPVREEYNTSENAKSSIDSVQNNSSPAIENQNVLDDTKCRPKQFENMDVWGLYEKDIKKEVLETLVPWEDSVLSYRCSDLSSSNAGGDLIISPPDTNYSTSDSYISPTFIGEERENEDMHFDKEAMFDEVLDSNSDESGILEKTGKDSLPQPSTRSLPFLSPGPTDTWNVSLNNVSHLKTEKSEITALPNIDTVLLNSEQIAAKYFSGDESISETTSGSEDAGVMHVSNQTVNHLSQPHGELNDRPTTGDNNVEIWERGILEDAWSSTRTSDASNGLNLRTSDLENEITVHGQAQGSINEDSKVRTQLSEHQLNLWHVHLQQNHQARWENSGNSGASQQGIDEYKGMDEMSRQLTISSVWNTTLQDNSVSPSVLPKLSCITDSEESTSTAEIPNLLENMRNSDIFKDLETEKSEIKMPFSSQINLVSQEQWKEPLQNSTECSAITPKEEKTSGCLDVSNPQNHSHSNTSQSLPTNTDKESSATEGATSPEMASASESSNRGEDSQENHSLRMPENLDIWNDSVKNSSQSAASSLLVHEAPDVLREGQESLSETAHSNLDICSFRLGSSEHSLEISDTHGTSFMSKSLQNKIQVNPSSESADVPDTTNMSMMDNSLSHEMDSRRSEASEGLEFVIKLPDEEYVDIASHDIPQILDIWNSHMCEEDTQSPGTSPETSEVVEMANTMDGLPGDTQIEGNCEEDNVSSGSTNDYTQSSATSPDISDACANLHVWESMPATNHSEDVWNITNDNKLENALEKKGNENKSQEESEETIDHKVPKNLDFWNAHVDDDTVSSLSSPEANEDSENSEAPQAVIEVDSNHEANEHEVPEITEHDYTQSNAVSSEDSLDVDTELENEVQIALLNNPENVKPWNIPKEENIMNLSTIKNDACDSSEYLGNWETIQGECQVNTFHENPDSPHVWNSCTMNYYIAPTSAAGHKEEDSSKNSDIWTISLQADSKRVVEVDQKSTKEAFGFPGDSSEWWNSQTHNDKPGQYSNSDGSLEIHQLENIKFDAWGAPIQNEELETAYPAHSGSHANQSAPLYFSEEKYESTVHSMNIHESEKDPDIVQFKLSDPLAVGKKERGLKEQPFITVDGDQDISKNPLPEKWQPDMPNTLTQTNLMLDLSKNNVDIITMTSNKDPFVQEQWNTSDTLELCSSPQNAFIANNSSQNIVEKSSLRGNELVEVPHITFSPYTLKEKTQENNQFFSVDPDLCADTEQLSILKADGENPDILSHSDQGSSSQAPNTPDGCHEYEVKQASLQFIHAWAEGGTEVSQFLPRKSNITKEADFDFKQQLVTCEVQTYPARNIQENTDETQVDQLISPTARKCSELKKENTLKKSDLGKSPTVELMDSSGSFAEDWEVASLNLKNTCYETNSVESCHDSASVNVVSSQRCLIATTFFPLGSSERSIEDMSVSAETELISVFDHTAMSIDKAEISHVCIDGNEMDIRNSSNSSISEVSKLLLSDDKQKVEIEKDAVDKRTLFLKTSLDGNDLGTPVSQHADNVVKEPEKLLDSSNPWFKESPSEQSPVVYSCPSDVSFHTEATGSKEIGKEEISLKQQFSGNISVEMPLSPLTPQNDEMSFLETKNSMIKDPLPFAEHPKEDCALGSETLKRLEREAETSNIDSPAGGVAGSPNASCDPLYTREKERNSTEIPELISTKSKEDMRTQVNKDQTAREMDYILFTGEENISVKKDILETKESDFAFQEANVAEQTEFHEAFSAGSLDMFQSISMINESKDQPCLSTECNSFHLAEKSPSVLPQRLGDEKRSRESPGQDHSWMVLGQNEVSDISPEEISDRTETMDSGSGHSVKELEIVLNQGWLHDTEAGVQLERSLHKSFEQEEYSPLDCLRRQDKNSDIVKTDALLLQVVGGHGKWEVHSLQHPEDGMATEQDMEEETAFLNSKRELSQASGLVPEDVGMDIPFEEGVVSPDATQIRREPPNSLDLNGSHPRRIKLTAPNINLSLDRSEGSVLSDDNLETPDEIDINVDDLDTPDEADSFEYTGNSNELDWKEDQAAIRDVFQEESESIPEYTAEEEREDNRLWRTVVIGEQEQRIDMKVIEPYKKVISHGGYYGDGLNAIIVFAACFLPDSSRADYNYVMENLFLYVISTLELMVAEDYMIVYLNGATPRRKMPGFGWMKKCYQMIDRRLRKNLKSFIIVHPSWFIRTVLAVTRPFISSKFSSKIQYVGTLAELSELIPMEYVHIPENIVKLDEELREASETAKLEVKLQKEKS